MSVRVRDRLRRWPLALGVAALWAGVTLSACAPADVGLSVGDAAPAFELPAVDAGRVALSDYAGRPVLLFFHMAVG